MRISDWSSDVCSSDLGAIDALRSDGLRIVMLTGDNATTANAVARIVGCLDEVRAELKPEDKAQAIADLKASGEQIAIAGGGIHEQPPLAGSDAGLALGTGPAGPREITGNTYRHNEACGPGGIRTR